FLDGKYPVVLHVDLMLARNGIIVGKRPRNDETSLAQRSLNLRIADAVGLLQGLAENLAKAPTVVGFEHTEGTEGGLCNAIAISGLSVQHPLLDCIGRDST